MNSFSSHQRFFMITAYYIKPIGIFICILLLCACGGSNNESSQQVPFTPAPVQPEPAPKPEKPAPNLAPNSYFVLPSVDTELLAMSDLYVEVEATDSDGTIESVSLYLNGELISEDTSSPYTWDSRFKPLKLIEAGNYALTAIATDNQGAQHTASIELTISPRSTSLIRDIQTAQRFMSFAGFGAPINELEELVGTDAADWLAEQMSLPFATFMDRVKPRLQIDNPDSRSSRTSDWNYAYEEFWQSAFYSKDVLRHRMLFALTQIVVVNPRSNQLTHRLASYLDVLGQNAFGNYKNLLMDITYNIEMAKYLTFLGSKKANPNTGSLPDENYARELLQLFSIGLVELQQNGQPKLLQGAEVETYDNDDITNLARVFTGFVYDRSVSGHPQDYAPAVIDDNQHSTQEKRFLNTVIPENTSGNETVSIALNDIFAHDSVAPFIARQLIQRFTASHPSPTYVERVANAFETGFFTADNGREFGSGEKGDLSATIAAILLEPSLFYPELLTDSEVSTQGKVREPVLLLAHFARAFKLANFDVSEGEWHFRNPESMTNSLGQAPFNSPSVFNFYRPGYIAPGAISGELGLTAPEFQILNSSSAFKVVNFLSRFIRRTEDNLTFIPNYDNELAMAGDAHQLVNYLDLLLTGERLPQDVKNYIVDTVNSIDISSSSEEQDKLARVRSALVLIAGSPTFAVAF